MYASLIILVYAMTETKLRSMKTHLKKDKANIQPGLEALL